MLYYDTDMTQEPCTAGHRKREMYEDKLNFLTKFICFAAPLTGLILFLILRKLRPYSAKRALVISVWGVVAYPLWLFLLASAPFWFL